MCFVCTIAFLKFVTSKTVRTCPNLTQSPVSTIMNNSLVTFFFFLHLKYIQGSFSQMKSFLKYWFHCAIPHKTSIFVWKKKRCVQSLWYFVCLARINGFLKTSMWLISSKHYMFCSAVLLAYYFRPLLILVLIVSLIIWVRQV